MNSFPESAPKLTFSIKASDWDTAGPGEFQPIKAGCKIEIWHKGSRTYIRVTRGDAIGATDPNNIDFWPSYETQKDDKTWSRDVEYDEDDDVDYGVHTAEITYDAGDGDELFKVRIVATSPALGVGAIILAVGIVPGKTGQWH